MSEFVQAVAVSLSAYAAGVWLYERSKSDIDKWIGRAALLSSLGVMIAFGLHSVRSCEKAMQQLASQSVVPASKIAQPSESPQRPEWTITTETGNVVSFNGDGTYGVRTATGGPQSGHPSAGWSYRDSGREDSGSAAGSFGFRPGGGGGQF